jgi:ribosomal protein L7/L12
MLPVSAAAQIDHLLSANQQIQAIKLFREHTGLGLAESKRAIDHWR